MSEESVIYESETVCIYSNMRERHPFVRVRLMEPIDARVYVVQRELSYPDNINEIRDAEAAQKLGMEVSVPEPRYGYGWTPFHPAPDDDALTAAHREYMESRRFVGGKVVYALDGDIEDHFHNSGIFPTKDFKYVYYVSEPGVRHIMWLYGSSTDVPWCHIDPKNAGIPDDVADFCRALDAVCGMRQAEIARQGDVARAEHLAGQFGIKLPLIPEASHIGVVAIPAKPDVMAVGAEAVRSVGYDVVINGFGYNSVEIVVSTDDAEISRTVIGA